MNRRRCRRNSRRRCLRHRCILSICRLHLAAASEKRERAHLDICSLNRLHPNVVFNDLLSMRISIGVDAFVCVSGSLALDAVRRKRFYRYFMCVKKIQ